MADFNKSDLSSIGQRIKDLRISKGLTQEELAAKTGVDRGRINMWERGQRDMKTQTIIDIAQTLGTDCHYLLTGTQRENIDFVKSTGLSSKVAIRLVEIHKGFGSATQLIGNMILSDEIIETAIYYDRYKKTQALYSDFKKYGIDTEHSYDFWIRSVIEIGIELPFDIKPSESNDDTGKLFLDILLSDILRYRQYEVVKAFESVVSSNKEMDIKKTYRVDHGSFGTIVRGL